MTYLPRISDEAIASYDSAPAAAHAIPVS
jgi:hypothetical protein